MAHRVVVTGMGCISPLGHDKVSLFMNLLEGRHGFSGVSLYDDPRMKAKVVAQVKDFDPKKYIARKLVKRMDRSVHFALAASGAALEDAKLDLSSIDGNRFGVISGTGVGGISSFFEEAKAYLKEGPNYVNPLCVPKFIPNMAAGQISITYGARGHVNTCVSACAAGTHAIGDAYRLIKDGYQDLMVAGATDACITPVMHAGFVNMGAHTLADDPDRASRPFDQDRGGFVLGEGAAYLILERRDMALKRQAPIYGEIIGYGQTSDGYHMTSPHPEGHGAVRAMRLALEEASLKRHHIGYINAHGTGTLVNDRIEAMAINTVFDHKPYVNSTKSMVGHLMGAGGALEALVCLMTLQHGVVHPSVGIDRLDPEVALNIVREKTTYQGHYALSNSFGFGGHNGCLIFKRGGDPA